MTPTTLFWILLINIPIFYPIIVLCYLPFRNKLAKPMRVILAQMCVICILFLLVGSIPGAFGFYVGDDMIMTLFIVFSFFYFRKTVNAEHQKRNFIFCIGIYAGGTAHGVRHIVRVTGIDYDFSIPQTVLVTIIIFVTVYLVIGFILQRFITSRMERVKARDMRLLWIIPFLFSILTYYYILSHRVVGVADMSFPIVFTMLTVISFVVFTMVIQMLDRAGINAQTELELTLEKEQRRNLQAENDSLDRLSRMKSEYMANMTHEAKTPLTVISVHVQQAREIFEEMAFQSTNEVQGADRQLNTDGEIIIDSLKRAQEEIMRVSRIINHNLWTASAQEVKHQMKLLDISEIITDTAEKYRSIAKIPGNTININTPANLPQIFGNDDQLVQVVTNLLTNASNHTKNGVIEVKAELATADGTSHIQVTITDNGTGIPPELLPHVFQRGVTGSASKGGTGMGLPISQNIIKTHGGDITIETSPGKGTAVIFILPVYDDIKEKAVSNHA